MAGTAPDPDRVLALANGVAKLEPIAGTDDPRVASGHCMAIISWLWKE
jgi:hypothetical protein